MKAAVLTLKVALWIIFAGLLGCGGNADTQTEQDIKNVFKESQKLNEETQTNNSENNDSTGSDSDSGSNGSENSSAINYASGKLQYEATCILCHGATGQKKNGVISEKLSYSQSLLAEYIELTMPDQLAHLCVDDCARDTAGYILNGYSAVPPGGSMPVEQPDPDEQPTDNQDNSGENSNDNDESSDDSSNENTGGNTEIDQDANELLVRGRQQYEAQCSACHGSKGIDPTGLFVDINHWQATLSIADLYEVIRDQMPKGDPAECGPTCSAEVTAYIAAGFLVTGDVPNGIPSENEASNGGSYNTGLLGLGDAVASRVFAGRHTTEVSATTALRIEAEHFDNGGAETSYHEADNEKYGEALIRAETGVDIEVTGDADGSHNIGWSNPGEWLEYTFRNTESQALTLQLRVATPRTEANSFSWSINGQDQGQIVLPATGGYQNYTFISADSEMLAPGWHSVRVEFDNNNMNFNYLILSRANNQPPAQDEFVAKPGTRAFHRLTNTEYRKTIETVFGVDVSGNELLADSVFHGFDRMESILDMKSQVRFEAYFTLAERIIDEFMAVPDNAASVMTCELNQGTLLTCGADIVRSWASTILRRAPGNEDVDRHLTFISSQMSLGVSPTESVQTWLKGLLVSPAFLHHVELDPDPESDVIHRITGRELANRLSYFLWCSPPDAQLVQLAASGSIFNQTVLEQQIDRMLNDEKASCLAESFAFQWFALGRFNQNSLILENQTLANAMLEETSVFFQTLMQSNAPIGALLSSTESYMDESLASYYGLPAPDSNGVVNLTGSNRQGLLTQGSVLVATGALNGSTFIKRGVFTLDNLLCDAPPPPPANIDQSLDTNADDTCQQCHRYINPIGVALNQFDIAGQFTNVDENNQPIDTRGSFYEGPSFNGAIEMINVLQADPRLADCAAEKFFSYAHARTPQNADDRLLLETLKNAWVNGGAGMKNLIKIIAASPSFQYRYAQQLEE